MDEFEERKCALHPLPDLAALLVLFVSYPHFCHSDGGRCSLPLSCTRRALTILGRSFKRKKQEKERDGLRRDERERERER